MTKIEKQKLDLEEATKTNLAEVFPEQLTHYLEESGMSNDRFCTLMGMTPNALYGWKRGKSLPTLTKVEEAAKVLGCEVKDLVTRKAPEIDESKSAEKLRLNVQLQLIDLPYEDVKLVAEIVETLSKR